VSALIRIGRVVVSGLADPVDTVALERALPGELSRALSDIEIGSPAEVRSVSVELPSSGADATSLARAVAAAIGHTGAQA
jgi:hypothetical protein